MPRTAVPMPRAEWPSESGVASSRAGTGIRREAYSAARVDSAVSWPPPLPTPR